jgi:hypothetical protein
MKRTLNRLFGGGSGGGDDGDGGGSISKKQLIEESTNESILCTKQSLNVNLVLSTNDGSVKSVYCKENNRLVLRRSADASLMPRQLARDMEMRIKELKNNSTTTLRKVVEDIQNEVDEDTLAFIIPIMDALFCAFGTPGIRYSDRLELYVRAPEVYREQLETLLRTVPSLSTPEFIVTPTKDGDVEIYISFACDAASHSTSDSDNASGDDDDDVADDDNEDNEAITDTPGSPDGPK